MRKLKPETKRAIMEIGAKQNLSYQDAMEHLIHEGVKAVSNPVENPLEKASIKA